MSPVASGAALSEDFECECEWPARCGQMGLQCEGCGGDLCVCPCGGESACFGCDDCDEFEPEEEP